MKISLIDAQRKVRDRRNIFLDGKFAFAISLELVLKNKLTVGQTISPKKIQDLIKADQVKKLTDKALRFLSYRPRSEKEIKDNLNKIKFGKEVKTETEEKALGFSVEETIKLLKKWRQIDDYEFAKWWILQRLEHKPRGLRLIKSELLQKGVNKEIIEEIIKNHQSRGSQKFAEGTIALTLIEKKLKRYKNFSKIDLKIKLGRYLVSRGFSWETIKEVIDTVEKKR